jgi:hypothetical protein
MLMPIDRALHAIIDSDRLQHIYPISCILYKQYIVNVSNVNVILIYNHSYNYIKRGLAIQLVFLYYLNYKV